jgi:4'-phosphopantetheinyl transferase superfamily
MSNIQGHVSLRFGAVRDAFAENFARRRELGGACKEAFIKALGGGLQIPLKSFEVSFAPGTASRLRGQGTERWELFSFGSGDDYVAALVIEGTVKRVKFWDWS